MPDTNPSFATESWRNWNLDPTENNGWVVRIPAEHALSSEQLFFLTLVSSSIRDGQAVVCKNLLPGITIRLETGWRFTDGHALMNEIWGCTKDALEYWLIDKGETSMTARFPTLDTLVQASFTGIEQYPAALEFQQQWPWERSGD